MVYANMGVVGVGIFSVVAPFSTYALRKYLFFAAISQIIRTLHRVGPVPPPQLDLSGGGGGLRDPFFSWYHTTGDPHNQDWQGVAKSGLNHWFLPVKTGWQKMWVAKSGKK